MESENLRQRVTDEPKIDDADAAAAGKNEDDDDNKKGKREGRKAMARRGFLSLAVALAVPVSLHLAQFVFFRSGKGAAHRPPSDKHFRFLSPWVLQLMFVGSSFLMGLSSWLVWADSGFHRKPKALAFYLGYIALSLASGPIVFGVGPSWVGLLVTVGLLGSLVGCARMFKEVNQTAGDLATLCVIWTGLVISLNFKLLYW